MSTGVEIFRYLLQTVLGLYLLAVLLRFLLQVVKADFYNPVSLFVVRVTNPALKPLRRVIPGFGGFDLAALTLAVLLQIAAIVIQLLLLGYSPGNPLMLIAWGLVGVLALLVKFYFFAILAMIIASWLAPGSYHPALLLLHQLVEPVMAPFRRILPPLGGLDLSPILVFVLINVVQILISSLARGLGMPAGLAIGL